MNVRYRVDLSQTERAELRALVNGGKQPVRRLKRMQILLAADAGVSDEAIEASVQTSGSTIYRTKKRFVEISLDAALSEEPRPGAARKLSGKDEVQLVALACSDPPKGCARWTLKLLANALLEVVEHQSVSRETIRRRLDDNDLKPWQKKMWCIAKIDGEYIARMEDLLDLYAEPHDPKRPVVCFDESPIQLIGEVRVPIVQKPGKRYRYDSEYKRNGTANLFVMVDANRSWRKVKVTDRRANEDFAVCMRDLVDVDYPDADKVRVVMDNLSTHTASAVYQTFPAAEARRILRHSTTHPATLAGSTWPRSRSASCADNVLTAGSIIATCSNLRSRPGSDVEPKVAHKSAGCSQHNRLETRWLSPIQPPRSMSHNLGGGTLVAPAAFEDAQMKNAADRAG